MNPLSFPNSPSTAKKHLLIIAYSDLENDPRVYRQVNYLKQFYQVTTVGWEPLQMEDVRFHRLVPKSRSRYTRLKHAFYYKLPLYHRLHWVLYHFEPVIEVLLKETFDLVIANDVEALPLAFQVAGEVPVVCDLHEFAPEQFAHQFKWRFLYQGYVNHLCEKYLEKCSHLFTVSEGIAHEYQRVFQVMPEVLTNAPEFQDLKPGEIQPRYIRLIHHGCAQPSRKIERMIEVMKYTDARFSLTLMLVAGSETYISELKTLSADMENVSFVEPVPMVKIPETINTYDMGIYFLEPVNFNYRFALPNKIFEFIQARLALLIGPTPGMAEVVREYGCGMVVDSYQPQEIADVLNGIDSVQINRYKQKSHEAAKELNAGRNMQRLAEVVERLLKEKRKNL